MATLAAPAHPVGDPRLVADGIYRLGDSNVNWYVIEEDARLTIVDTGLPAHWPQLPALLRTIGRTFADVSAVVLTHQHPDHLGVAERIREAANARVLIHPSDAVGALRGGRGEGSPSLLALIKAMRRGPCRRYLVASMRGGVMRVPAVANVGSLTDGERLGIPGRPRVIHTPGHTPGECVLYLEDRGVLFSGDALVTFDPTTERLGPCLLRPPFAFDHAQERGSLVLIENLRASLMLPGHGEPWRRGVAEAVRLARVN